MDNQSNKVVALSLESLARGPLGAEFLNAMQKVQASIKVDKDLPGKRTITVKLSIEPDMIGQMPIAKIEHTVSTAVPKRATKSVGIISSYGEIGINPTSPDARQPDLFGGRVAEQGAPAPEGVETTIEEE